MGDHKMETYMAAAQRYEMRDVIELAKRLREMMGNEPFTVGIIGNHFKVISLLVKLTGITELEDISAQRSFCMEITDGDETACFELNRVGGNRQITLQEMRDALEESGSLESEEELPVFSVRLTVQDWKMSGVRLLAIGSAADFQDIQWQEVTYLMDECCMVLSAAHLLSMEERSLIRKEEVSINTYILSDMNLVIEEKGQRDVFRQLISFIGGSGENVVRDDDRERMQELCGIWESRSRDTDRIAHNRQEKLERTVHCRLKSNLENIKSLCLNDKQKIQDMINRLDKAYSQIPAYKERTVRHIKMYYLEEIKTELESELTRFHAQLRQDLKTGIDEENDVKQLQSALTGYIMGEWEEFTGGTLKKHLEDTALRIDTEIENYIGQNVETLLQQQLGEEAYNDLKSIMAEHFEDNGIFPQDGSMEMNGSAVLFDNGGRHSAFGLLPKCVMAAGGVAILCSAFLPGALMVFMGYEMNSGAKAAAKEQLLQEGRELSDRCFKEVQKKMQEAFTDMEKDVAELVEESYDTVMNRLMSILEEFKDDDAGIRNKMAQIEARLQELG